MSWIRDVFADFFMAIGAIVTFGVVIVIAFFDGKVEDVSIAWIVFLALLYAWVRSEIRWRQERDGG